MKCYFIGKTGGYVKFKTKKNPEIRGSGGSGEIRTHGGRKPSPVFKTGALNRSATLPVVGRQ